jgi:RNA 3'-terminal phosphate cyclase (ATP)
MIKIDGSHGEGGGQILRTSLALSCITGEGFDIYDIRKGRKNPGLQPQHLTGVRAAQVISKADVEGAELSSQRLCFSPGEVIGGEYSFDVSEIRGSAGSVTLVLQAILPSLAMAKSPSRVTVKGGTHVTWSPPFHYMRDVLLPLLSKVGIRAALDIEKWGWYPIGGGKASLSVEPLKGLSPISIKERGRLLGLSGISALSNLPVSIAERQRDQGNWLLKGAGLSAQIEIIDAPSIGKGTFFFILAEFENIRAGFSALGERGKKAEAVAEEAVKQFLEFYHSDGALDPHLADQVIPYLALCSAPSAFTTPRVTRHLLTNAWVTQKFLPVRIEVEGEEGRFGTVFIEPA